MTSPTAAQSAIPLMAAIPAFGDTEEVSGNISSAVNAGGADDSWQLADFDLPTLIAGLNPVDVSAALAELEEIREPYTTAARREGKLLAADFSDEITAVLHARRNTLQATGPLQVGALPVGAASGAGGDRRRAREAEALTDLAVRVNAWRVDDAVRRFAPPMSPAELEEVRAAAAEGLARAVVTFDRARGRFGDWAFKPMRGAVLDAVHALLYPMLSCTEFLARVRRCWLLARSCPVVGSRSSRPPRTSRRRALAT